MADKFFAYMLVVGKVIKWDLQTKK
jgi:hypothetical protein